MVRLAICEHYFGAAHAQHHFRIIIVAPEDGLSHRHSDGRAVIAQRTLNPAHTIIDVAVEQDILHVNHIVVSKDDVHFAALHIKADIIIISKNSLASSAQIGSQFTLRHGGNHPVGRCVEVLHQVAKLILSQAGPCNPVLAQLVMIVSAQAQHSRLGTHGQGEYS